MRTTRLSILFDHHTASTSLQRIPCSSNTRWRTSGLFRKPGCYVVHDLLSAVQLNSADSLNRGVEFLRWAEIYILLIILVSDYDHYFSFILSSDSHWIDIGVLCEFMEYLCGALISAHSFNARASLHGVALPESWIVRILRGACDTKDLRTNVAEEYLKCLALLLNSLWTGEGTGESSVY